MSYVPTTNLAKEAIQSAPSCKNQWLWECDGDNPEKYSQCAKLTEWVNKDPDEYYAWLHEVPYCSNNAANTKKYIIAGVMAGLGLLMGIAL